MGQGTGKGERNQTQLPAQICGWIEVQNVELSVVYCFVRFFSRFTHHHQQLSEPDSWWCAKQTKTTGCGEMVVNWDDDDIRPPRGGEAIDRCNKTGKGDKEFPGRPKSAGIWEDSVTGKTKHISAQELLGFLDYSWSTKRHAICFQSGNCVCVPAFQIALAGFDGRLVETSEVLQHQAELIPEWPNFYPPIEIQLECIGFHRAISDYADENLGTNLLRGN